ncbi:uncharacterized protein LOC119696404 isoform X3 [Motacilla alba alba]|uniref:uncharacterized protein LOC119696404 isoform X3 n=1 Tax=Motacilla alba alba TaxID=1094192 RepID=UPI0018D508E1|nr:uncharacterized protein LOC119696404 isoform X3 [Motacilla alba alba]
MEPKLSLEQRTERLVQRSQALLRPRPRGPERAKPLLGSAPCSSTLEDPLVQWRLRRCRGEEPALDTPLVGRARLGSAAPRGSLQGAPPGKSRDSRGALQGAVPWQSRDPPEAPRPIGRRFCPHQGLSSPLPVSPEPLWQEPCWRPHDSHKTLWPTRSSSLDTLQGAGYSQSGPSRPSWNAHLSTPAHGGANKAMRPQNCTGEPARPRGGSRDCGSHHAPRPRQSRRSRECPLRSVPAAPQVLSGCRPGP